MCDIQVHIIKVIKKDCFILVIIVVVVVVFRFNISPDSSLSILEYNFVYNHDDKRGVEDNIKTN